MYNFAFIFTFTLSFNSFCVLWQHCIILHTTITSTTTTTTLSLSLSLSLSVCLCLSYVSYYSWHRVD